MLLQIYGVKESLDAVRTLIVLDCFLMNHLDMFPQFGCTREVRLAIGTNFPIVTIKSGAVFLAEVDLQIVLVHVTSLTQRTHVLFLLDMDGLDVPSNC